MPEQSESAQNSKPRVIVCIPTYNNCSTIGDVVASVLPLCRDIIVVDDGSTDSTHEVLSGFKTITVIRFARNCGKGTALKTAFAQAKVMGFTHAITMDADGQHLAHDLPILFEQIAQDPAALWVGNRVLATEGVAPPARSRFGRSFGNFWYKFNTGIKLDDTQCGFRAYPLATICSLDIKGERYEYEQDALIKAAWNGVAVKQVAIHLKYQPVEERISHFRPFRDFVRISAINARAGFLRVAFPVLTVEAPGKTLREKIRALIRYELKAHTTPYRAAFSLALGVTMGILPIHGFQVLSLIGLAFVMRLNRPLAFLGVCVSSPPFLPFIIIAAVAVGRLFVPDHAVSFAASSTTRAILQGGLEFVVGSTVLAVLAGITVFAISFPLFARLNSFRQTNE